MYKIFIVPIVGFALCFGNISFAGEANQVELRASVSYYDTLPFEDEIPIASMICYVEIDLHRSRSFRRERLFLSIIPDIWRLA